MHLSQLPTGHPSGMSTLTLASVCPLHGTLEALFPAFSSPCNLSSSWVPLLPFFPPLTL